MSVFSNRSLKVRDCIVVGYSRNHNTSSPWRGNKNGTMKHWGRSFSKPGSEVFNRRVRRPLCSVQTDCRPNSLGCRRWNEPSSVPFSTTKYGRPTWTPKVLCVPLGGNEVLMCEKIIRSWSIRGRSLKCVTAQGTVDRASRSVQMDSCKTVSVGTLWCGGWSRALVFVGHQSEGSVPESSQTEAETGPRVRPHRRQEAVLDGREDDVL